MAKRLSIVAIFLLFAGLVAANPATLPATNPAATQPATSRPSHVAIVPPGYHEITIGARGFICKPEDDAWIQAAVAGVTPATRPTTMPSDILQTIANKREQLFQQISAELGLTDSKSLAEAFDKEMIPPLQKLRDVNPKVYYLPITRSDLIKLLENGWSDPRYEFLRTTGDVHYISHVDIAIDRRPDDVVNWVELGDVLSIENQTQVLRNEIMDYETEFPHWQSGFAQTGVRHVMTAIVKREAVDELHLPDSLEWLGAGLENVYGAKYAQMVAGTPAELVVATILMGDPRNPLAWRPLDLTHPLNLEALRPEYLPLYVDAAEHKGTFVAQQWAKKATKDSLAKTLAALKQKPPTTPDELVRTIKTASGIDITPWMLPDFQSN